MYRNARVRAPADGDAEHGDEGAAEGVEVLGRLGAEEGYPHNRVCRSLGSISA